MSTTKALGLGLLCLLPVVSSHIVMSDPVPYGAPDNSPLAPSGSNYPCKSSDYTINKLNNWTVGETVTLSFKGSAVHGGGSGQIAVTLDKQPTISSTWKVVHSFEGGFPGVGAPSNWPFKVIQELPSGEYTMAFTWFNRIGNREMYMNCAPISVGGGSDDKSAFEQLPDMALANIAVGGGNCNTKETVDYTFQDPGKYVTRTGPGPFMDLCGGGGNSPGQPGPSQQPVPSSQTQNNGMYTPSASQAPASSAQSSKIPVTSTIHTLVTVTSYGTPSIASSVTVPSSPASSTLAQPATSQALAIPSSDCNTEGAVVCNEDGSKYGLCNHGKVVFQPVADGTKCSTGAIQRRRSRYNTHEAQHIA